MLKRILTNTVCRLGLHQWLYRETDHGVRDCDSCGRRQELIPDRTKILADYGRGRRVFGGQWRYVD